MVKQPRDAIDVAERIVTALLHRAQQCVRQIRRAQQQKIRRGLGRFQQLIHGLVAYLVASFLLRRNSLRHCQ
jgi:hypothetical protein